MHELEGAYEPESSDDGVDSSQKRSCGQGDDVNKSGQYLNISILHVFSMFAVQKVPLGLFLAII